MFPKIEYQLIDKKTEHKVNYLLMQLITKLDQRIKSENIFNFYRPQIK
jgi:hypothetical protein